jgi:Domain of unknown function (DUF4412)
MLRCFTRIFSLLVLIFAGSFALAQAEFSAAIVDLQKPGTPTTAKIFFAKDKMRIESQSSNARASGAIIVNFSTETSTILMPQQHMYMDMTAQSQTQRQGLYSFFRTGDVENACGDWQKLARNQGGSCHKVGNESVNGRSTVEYEGVNANGDVSHFWLDPKLRFPVKWESKSSSGELRDIQEGAQPASLFEIPAGYTKMEMPGGMMQQPH